MLPVRMVENLSIPFLVNSLLHLANEKQLELHLKDEGELAEFHICVENEPKPMLQTKVDQFFKVTI